jgi:hypothetical protein
LCARNAKYKYLIEALNEIFIEKISNAQFSNGIGLHNFRWSCIQLSYNPRGGDCLPGHTHMSDTYPTTAEFCLGDYRGGRLWVEDPRGKVGKVCTDTRIRKGNYLDERNLVSFFASKWHGTEFFRGERITVVFFSRCRLDFLAPSERKELRDLGFHLPPLPKIRPPPKKCGNQPKCRIEGARVRTFRGRFAIEGKRRSKKK